ncbi:odorant receptor 85b-like [Chelonus insularis]|uniref:odorant receptor 85b-like n=1 Tax=Chelonus insularis TaxID=460826 RepID=UPI00158E3703|nr:odorant receptor 85b-like [Chelonus insularis]
MVISKYFFLLARKQKIRKCLEHIDIDWRRAKQSEDREVMLAYAKSGRFISTICASFMYGGGILYQTIAPLARGKILTANNISRYPLPYPVYAGLFVADRSPYYEIVFTFQWISSFLRYSINVATCSLGAVVVLHTCGQLKIVISRLENFINTQDTIVEIKYKVAEIVELHLRSMSFITQIEEVLNEVCLIEVLGSTTIICLIGYYILMEFETDHLRAIDLSTYSVLFTSFTFNIFILCHIGEKLSQQKQEVGTIAYMIDWYKLSGKDARMLILLLRISNYPIRLTAGKMAELSYRSFASIIKTSMTFLNLLRTILQYLKRHLAINMLKKPEILRPVPKPTDQSKNDMKYSIEINRWFLIPLGILPFRDKPTFIHKCISYIFVLICATLLCFIFIPTLLHMLLANINLKIKIKLIGPTSFTIMVMSKYCFLLARKKKIRKCLEHIDIDWRRANQSEDRKIMLASAKNGRFISTLCASFMYGGGFFYQTIAPLSRGKILTASNISRHPLPSPVYAGLFTADHSPYYEIVFATQWISSFIRYSINVATCSLGAVLVLHACGQLQIVMSRLESFINKRDTQIEVKYKIAEIVELHLRSMSLIVRIEELLNEVCLVEFLGCTINICLLGYYIIAHSRPIEILTYGVLFISFTFNIFIFCYIGELLTQQGQKVGMIAYMIDWYKLPENDAKMLILVLTMSNYQNSITAGKMAQLSYRSFGGILKTAMAYLNFLRTLV